VSWRPSAKAAWSLLKEADTRLSQAYLARRGESDALLVFFFHGLVASQKERQNESVDPGQLAPVQSLGKLIEYFLAHGYSFVSPTSLLAGLPKRKQALLTFDDGYANNQLALPVLKEYKVPALFCVSTGPSFANRAYWWDVLYRERRRAGATLPSIRAEQASLKSYTHTQIDDYLVKTFGLQALTASGDEDRPLTPAELLCLSREHLVHLGNHTRDHGILTNYEGSLVEEQIVGAQNDLRQLTGIVPRAIAYPDGGISEGVVRVARRAGLQLGFTTAPGKNGLPIVPGSATSMALRRFPSPNGQDADRQFLRCRSDVLLYPRLRALLSAKR
jgi:peptidoglycan/xylan/chitin deacetylase (PgdA/CDA1 family)